VLTLQHGEENKDPVMSGLARSLDPTLSLAALTRSPEVHPAVYLERLPGMLLCSGVALAAVATEHTEAALFGRAWLEALVLAILLGTALRTAWTPGGRWRPGIHFAAKTLLEVAVVLLGASVSAATVVALGPILILGIAVLVAIAVCGGYGIGRLLGLSQRMAILVACGNAICGNSAIAAVAPVIGAGARDITASIAFTAVLGVVAVLGLPLLVPVLGLSDSQFGILAGLTVYAVPQVLAATAPVSALAVQVGTLVKLVRVVMLGPVVLVLSLVARRFLCQGEAEAVPHTAPGIRPGRGRFPLHRSVPWFVVGFLALAVMRSLGFVPEPMLKPTAVTASVLTVVAMAALGLGVDVRVVARPAAG